MRDEDLKTYSVLIRWNDNDSDEGEFGTSVWARSPEEAEAHAREEMADEADEDADELGTTIELSEGAYWKAADLEQALRKIVALTNSSDPSALAEISSIGGAALSLLDELPVAEPLYDTSPSL